MKKIKDFLSDFFKNQRYLAIGRIALAVILAVVLLWVSGFAFVYQLGGAEAVTDGSQLTGQAYVSADIRYVMDVCGSESNASGKVLYYYAIAPLGNRFVLLRFDASMLEEITALEEETMNYLTGNISAMSFHLPVRGMVKNAESAAYSLLSEWFNTNIEWMSMTGVVGENPEASAYLMTECIFVDCVGSCNYTGSVILSIAVLLLVLYALTEAALLLTGYYRDSKIAARTIRRAKREKEKAKAKLAAEKALAAAREETEKIKAAAAELAELNAIGKDDEAPAEVAETEESVETEEAAPTEEASAEAVSEEPETEAEKAEENG